MVQWSGLCTPLQGCVCLVTQSFLTLCDPTHCRPPGSSVHGILQARILEGLPFLPPGDILDPGIEPASAVSPALQADALPSELPEKPINYLSYKKTSEVTKLQRSGCSAVTFAVSLCHAACILNHSVVSDFL